MIHLCGSLRLAMFLLFTIGAACAFATVCESNFNTKIAQAYVYKAPWFIGWLFVLCLNLTCAAVSRWPWQKKHIGFVITHAGIIILLIGAMVGQKLGFEASVTLQRGEAPTNRLIFNNTILQADSPRDGSTYTIPVDVEVSPPSERHPKAVALLDTDLKLFIDRYSENLVLVPELLPSPEPGEGSPGIELQFSTQMMGQSVPITLIRQPLSASRNEFFGRARIEWLDTLPKHDLPGKSGENQAVNEIQIALAQHPEIPLVTNISGTPSGYSIRLVFEGREPQIMVEAPSKQRALFPLESVLGKPISLQGDNLKITVENYWPDLEMQGGKPVSVSEQPNNPAVQVLLTGTKRSKPDIAGNQEERLLEMAPLDKTHIAYQISRGGVVSSSGTAAAGALFPLGWADWKAEVRRVLPDAIVKTTTQPSSSEKPTEQSFSGVHAELRDARGGRGAASWIASGRTALLELDNQSVRIGFGSQVHYVNFAIGLEQFEVPRDEGTDTPSDFISTVSFHDPGNGEVIQSRIHMNHPAAYPPGFWRIATGLNYKFSQASWNPADPNETTLQVLHDPGWLLKWVGSLLICAGIASMFYFIPRTGSSTRPVRKVKETVNAETNAMAILSKP